MLLLVTGAGAGYYLSQQEQDIRHQASGGETGQNLVANSGFEAGYLTHKEQLVNGGFENDNENWSLEGPGAKDVYENEGNKFMHIDHRGDSGRARVIRNPWTPIKDGYTYQIEIRGQIERLASKDNDHPGGIYADEWCINEDFWSDGENPCAVMPKQAFRLTGRAHDDFVTKTKRFTAAKCVDVFKNKGFPEKCYTEGNIKHTLPIYSDVFPNDALTWDYASLREVTGPSAWEDPQWSNVGVFITKNEVHSGEYALKMSGKSYGRNINYGSLRKSQWLQEGAGAFYKLTACGKRVDGQDLSRVAAEEYDDSNDFKGGHYLKFTSDQWECKSTSFSTNADTTKIPVSVFLNPKNKGNKIGDTSFFVDDIRLERTVPVPNCKNISGPTTLQVGETGTYSADFFSPQGELVGKIGVDTGNNNFEVIAHQSSANNNLSASGDWTPQEVGIYLVTCRAWNDGRAECRYPDHVDQEPRYPCEGPNHYLEVNVIDPSECTGPEDCNDDNPCTTDTCVDGSCTYPNVSNGTACSDDKLCYDGQCIAPTPVPTREPTPTGLPETGLRFKINLDGIPQIEKNTDGEVVNHFPPNERGEEILVQITMENLQGQKTQPVLRRFIYVDEGADSYYQMAEPFEFEDFPAGEYQFLFKGPMHRQMKFCENNQSKGTLCSTADRIQISPGDDIEFDFRANPLQAGDLPISSQDDNVQDGVVNVQDYAFMVGCFSKMRDEACVARADVNFDGVVNNLDWTLLVKTLQSAPDEV